MLAQHPRTLRSTSSFIQCYHWQELPPVSFLLHQKLCCNERMFVTTKVCLPWQNYICREIFFHDKLSSQTYFCQDKHKSKLVATKLCLLQKYWLRQKFCHDKNMFVMTSIQKTCSVTTNTYLCHNKTFVLTKMILVAAPASDTMHTLYFSANNLQWKCAKYTYCQRSQKRLDYISSAWQFIHLLPENILQIIWCRCRTF